MRSDLVSVGWNRRLLRWDRELSVLCFVAVLQLVGFLGVYVKYVYMQSSEGFLAASRFSGRLAATDFTLFERLQFFSNDVVLNLAILPAAFALVVRLLPTRIRFFVMISAAFSLAAVHFIELLTYSTIGRFVSWDLLKDAFSWLKVQPDSLDENVSGSAAFKLAALLIASGVAAAAAVAPTTGWIAWLKAAMAAGATVVFVAAIALELAPRDPVTATLAQTRAGLVMQLAAFAPTNASRYIGLSREEILRRFRERVHSPACPDGEKYFSRERGKDILLFVYETGPAQAFDKASELEWLPTLKALSKQSLVAERHYTTYPYTSDALFSMLSGRYPLNRRNFIRGGRASLPDSLPVQLRNHGYDFRVYSSFGDAFEADTDMFAALGASVVYVPDGAAMSSAGIQRRVDTVIRGLPPESPAHNDPIRDRIRARLAQDLAALDRLETDVLEKKRKGERFVAMYLPQIGHAPWFDLDGDADVVTRGAAAMRIQDEWLGRLVDKLRAEGHLDSTVLLVTADHGVRTRNEDARFEGGTLDDYSFRVPLVIYAPDAVQKTHTITQVTSHVDIASTMLNLLGVSAGPTAQGNALWCSDIDQRATFFFARGYLGADGYHAGSSWVMHAAFTGAVYESDSLSFSSRRLASPSATHQHLEMLSDVRQLTIALNMPAGGNALPGSALDESPVSAGSRVPVTDSGTSSATMRPR